MSPSPNTVWLLKRIAELAHDTYMRAMALPRQEIAQADLNAYEAAWRQAQLAVEEVEPQPPVEDKLPEAEQQQAAVESTVIQRSRDFRMGGGRAINDRDDLLTST